CPSRLPSIAGLKATPAKSSRQGCTSQSSVLCQSRLRDAASIDDGFDQLWQVPRHLGSSRPAVPQLSLWGVDRKSLRSPPCRRRKQPKNHLRDRRRSLPAPPSPALRRRESTHGARRARSSTPGTVERLAASRGGDLVLPRPAMTRRNLELSNCALYP